MNPFSYSNKQKAKEHSLKALIEQNISSEKVFETNILNVIPYNCIKPKDKFNIDNYYINQLPLPPLIKLFNINNHNNQKRDQSMGIHYPPSMDKSNLPKQVKSTYQKQKTLPQLKNRTLEIQQKIKISKSKYSIDSFELMRIKHHIYTMVTLPMKNILAHPHHVFSVY